MVKAADEIYKSHVFVNVDNEQDYGLPYLDTQEIEKVFGQNGEFDKYSKHSLLDEIKANFLGEDKTVLKK